MGVLQRLGDLDADRRHAPGIAAAGVPGRRWLGLARQDGGSRGVRGARSGRVGGYISPLRVGLSGWGASGNNPVIGEGRDGRSGPAATDHAARVQVRFRGRVVEATDLPQHRVEAEARDELHDVVVHALELADSEDGHDIGVVQLGGGAAPPAGTAGVARDRSGPCPEDLEGDATAERLLLGFVDDAHAARPTSRRIR